MAHGIISELNEVNRTRFMPEEINNKKPDNVMEVLEFLIKHMNSRFDEVVTRLDRIEFLVTAQDRRLTTLEDRMRIVATKLGLEFRQQI